MRSAAKLWISLAVLSVLAAMSAATAAASPDLLVAVPSKAAGEARADHFYRPGYEVAVTVEACKLLQVRCRTLEVDNYPSANDFGATGAQAAVFGSEFAVKATAEKAGFNDAIQQLAEDGKLAQLKRKYLILEKPWPGALAVGVEPGASESNARVICAQIHANCRYVRNASFDALAKQFSAKEIQLVLHSQSHLFASKTLEDRVAIVQQQIEAVRTRRSE